MTLIMLFIIVNERWKTGMTKGGVWGLGLPREFSVTKDAYNNITTANS